MSGPIIITVPNFLGYDKISEEISTESNSCNMRGKKRRLNLSWEEKMQRKKLKNRVAAQTSRDRKKAKMDELTFEVSSLKAECERLRLQNEKLQLENAMLHRKISAQDEAATANVGSGLLKGSAVSTFSPLPQEGAPELAHVADVKASRLLKQKLCSILAVLICQISCASSSPKSVSKILQETSFPELSSMKTLRILQVLKHPLLKWSVEHCMHQNGWNIHKI